VGVEEASVSVLTLIRHGQAQFGAHDYDALSPLGQRQCAALRDYWAQRGETFEEVWSGTLQRQRDSARALAEPQADARWNEYDADGIVHHLAPALAGTSDNFRRLYEAHQQQPQDPRAFQRMFEPLMEAWLAGQATHPAVEPWAAFRQRVQAALQAILERPGSRRVAVFTSGGPIGLAVVTALGASDRQALALNWRLRNASLTTFLYSPGRLSLDTFNATPHLLPADETYR
jgi:broad specificity phosphatase PhoE